MNNTFNIWEMGELFFRKYITAFNFDSKTISFYKTQVDEINQKTEIVPDEHPEEEESEKESERESERESEKESERESEKESKEESKDDNEKSDTKPDSDDKINIWVIIGIGGGILFIIAIVVIILLVLKLKKFRKKRADELIDDYEYPSRVVN